MKRSIWLILFGSSLVIFGCGKGKETTPHQGRDETGRKKEAKKADDMNMEMKGLTMESIQKEGKMQEVAPGTVQITPENGSN